MSKFYEFKDKDRASFGGLKGTVSQSGIDHADVIFYPDDRTTPSYRFLKDGRFGPSQAKPLLKRLVKRKKKKEPVRGPAVIYFTGDRQDGQIDIISTLRDFQVSINFLLEQHRK